MELLKVFPLVELVCLADQLVTPMAGWMETPPFRSASHPCINEQGSQGNQKSGLRGGD